MCIFTELKKNNQIPKTLYFEENVCLFTKHRYLKMVKCKNCYGCENSFQDHVCLSETDAEWIDILYKEILA